nr:unnamed protein product [Digitaria exilis]
MGDVGTPRGGLARSSSGVWWKLGDTTAAADASEVDRRLRAIADEEAAVRARVERRRDAAPSLRRRIAVASVSLETVALVYGLWAARRRRLKKKLLQLERLRTERKAKIGNFRGSHHNLQKLIEKYDPDSADDSNNMNTNKKLKRTHSRLSFHVGDE